MRHYFAYSSSLDKEAFDEWKLQHGYAHFNLPKGRAAEAQNVSYIFDFPSRWWGGRVLGLTQSPGTNSQVRGLLFEIEDSDWGIVRHKEGVVTGASIEIPVQVKLQSSGELIQATAFVTNPERASLEGPISQRFLETLSRAYESCGLQQSFEEVLRIT